MTLSMTDFARCHVAGRGFAASEDFPRDAWRALADAGLFRTGLPARFGGDGGGYADIARAEHDLAAHGGCVGFAMSWTGHQLVGRYFIAGFGSEEQKAALLPGLASGALTLAVAISEPGAGAHPKHLRTSATRDGDGFVIDGEKAYVTNGPLADAFIVLAITAVEAGRKRYSAFLVPRATSGLAILPMEPFGALRPSPHCRLRFDGCRVSAEAMLGPAHAAYEAMARPFRDVEDAVGASGSVGICGFVARALATASSDEAAAGEIAATLALMEQGARAAALSLDAPPAQFPAGALTIAIRLEAARLLQRLRSLRGGLDAAALREVDLALADIAFSQTIAQGPRQARLMRLGADFIAGS
ncbi:MAG: acyl-CoA dehydrogenase family protein [Alphaproteobacteria bacterium]|nr:acyl-CoA dehydrogenase family protein [Alphaproteobacteria bacterium]MCW5740307.1 acyl-CoA dehydrogenase family protein [Alphaproteobacteria bacterium]